jgi:outer membrane protein assembly factor BamB
MKSRTFLSLTAASALFVYLIMTSGCSSCGSGSVITPSWPQWRGDEFRSATQLFETELNDVNNVITLHVAWTFTDPNGPPAFRASPVVFNGKVYIGDSNGFFYCLDASTGNKLWQYPLAPPGLTTQFPGGNPSGLGIASSAAVTVVGSTRAVIFGAPDQSSGLHLGDGHLFALNADTGALIWESPAVALVTGLTDGDTSQKHEQIGYSAPLIFNDHVYIGIGDHGDNPIQQGKVVAVKLSDGSIDSNFSFVATGTRGGGVWGSLAAWDDVYLTTGNTRCDAVGCQPEPSPNHGLSMLRLGKDTGKPYWKLQPVPFVLDEDPDWSAGPAVMYAADCGPAIVSTQKDGWTWAVQAGSGSPAPPPASPGPPNVMWAFPPGPWVPGGFTPQDHTVHGDTPRYIRPGATWGDVYIGTMGGWETTTNAYAGLTRLHALNFCETDAKRVRWVKDIPGADPNYNGTYPLGPPTVTTDGMVFVGTNQGHIVAIADPQLHPALGNRCEDPGIPSGQCQGAGRRLVPDPWIRDIALPGSPADGIFGEPVIVNGQVFVATISGNVYMLKP